MLRPVRFPESLFHSLRSFLRPIVASIGILLALALLLAIYHGSYARASEAGPLATNVVRTATDSNWRQSPSSVLNSAGRNSVTLSPCPPGGSGLSRGTTFTFRALEPPRRLRLSAERVKAMDARARWS
jgi:hypothetical protein